MKLKRTLVENAFRRLLYCTKTLVESFVEYEYEARSELMSALNPPSGTST